MDMEIGCSWFSCSQLVLLSQGGSSGRACSLLLMSIIRRGRQRKQPAKAASAHTLPPCGLDNTDFSSYASHLYLQNTNDHMFLPAHLQGHGRAALSMAPCGLGTRGGGAALVSCHPRMLVCPWIALRESTDLYCVGTSFPASFIQTYLTQQSTME